MSEYPATLGDLAAVEARLDAEFTRLAKRLTAQYDALQQEVDALRDKVMEDRAWSDLASQTLLQQEARVRELEKLWLVARDNPELVRELAAQALKDGAG